LIGYLDPKVPIQIIDSASFDIDIISNKKPTVLVMSSRWPPPPSLLDPRLKEYNIQTAFATYDIQLHEKLEKLLLLNKNKLLSEINKLNNKKNLKTKSILHNNDNKEDREDIDDDINEYKDEMIENLLNDLNIYYNKEEENDILRVSETFHQQKTKRNKKRSDLSHEKSNTQYVYIFPPEWNHRLPPPQSHNNHHNNHHNSHHNNHHMSQEKGLSQIEEEGCDDSCWLWQLDIHALNIRNSPSTSQSTVTGIMKKNDKFYGSCILTPPPPPPHTTDTFNSSISLTQSISSNSHKAVNHCEWLRLCTCNHHHVDSETTTNGIVKTHGLNSYINRVGDRSDSSSIRAVIANSPKMMFQISPSSHLSSPSHQQQQQGLTKSTSSSSSSSNLVLSVTDWIYSHLSLWYYKESEEDDHVKANKLMTVDTTIEGVL